MFTPAVPARRLVLAGLLALALLALALTGRAPSASPPPTGRAGSD